ncbi:bolA-like protein 3 isoform X1 [Equus caballus]|uniref:bolA-like protein 3 isoform X1 n=1 Tax=Equus caballus TaxID=9796 RepID=UPI0038B23B35
MAAWSPAAAAPLLRGIRGLPLLHCAQRMFASQTEGELKVTQILKEKFPRATVIKVTDISGGCGAMYEIQIESEEFKEKRTVQQHRMVNQGPTGRKQRLLWVEMEIPDALEIISILFLTLQALTKGTETTKCLELCLVNVPVFICSRHRGMQLKIMIINLCTGHPLPPALFKPVELFSESNLHNSKEKKNFKEQDVFQGRLFRS